MERSTRTQFAALGAAISLLFAPAALAQTTRAAAATSVEQPDAPRIKNELSELLQRYPPSLRRVLTLDPALLNNQAFLAPYPAMSNFLSAHPEVARNPSFFLGQADVRPDIDASARVLDMWRNVIDGLGVFAGFGLAIGVVVWFTRTVVDYRRWSRLAKVQTEVHTKLLDRFTANNDLVAYIQSPSGSRFLQSSPIMLDAAPRSVAAPFGRILWSIQGGVVLIAGGIGLQAISGQVTTADAAVPLHALGVLGIALGIGFLVSAILSFVISQRFGLLESPANPLRRQGTDPASQE